MVMEHNDILLCASCGLRFPAPKLIILEPGPPHRSHLRFCRPCVLRLLRSYRAWMRERLG